MPNPTGQFLHIPFKSWAEDNKPFPAQEKQNYDEIERWALRLPRGIVARGQSNNPATGITNASLFEVLSIGPVGFEQTRQYKITAQWPGLTTVAAGDIMELKLALNPQPGAAQPVGQLLFWNSVFKIIPNNTGAIQAGGNIVIYIISDHSLTGPYLVQLWAGIAYGTGPATIFAQLHDPANPPGLNGLGRVITILVEDLGVRTT